MYPSARSEPVNTAPIGLTLAIRPTATTLAATRTPAFRHQARKFKVGLVLAHQNLEQLAERLRATIMASTSIKFAGGVSARDAAAFAKEMCCEPEFVQSMRKHTKATKFACWI